MLLSQSKKSLLKYDIKLRSHKKLIGITVLEKNPSWQNATFLSQIQSMANQGFVSVSNQTELCQLAFPVSQTV